MPWVLRKRSALVSYPTCITHTHACAKLPLSKVSMRRAWAPRSPRC
jgi:hypothetical protein